MQAEKREGGQCATSARACPCTLVGRAGLLWGITHQRAGDAHASVTNGSVVQPLRLGETEKAVVGVHIGS